MKNYHLALLLLFAFSLSNCSNNDGDLNDPNDPNDPNNQWSTFCSDYQGGEFDFQLEGQDWSSNCGFASYTETITDQYEQKNLIVYAYNHDLTFSDNTDIEVIAIQRSEITTDGQTTAYDLAFYYEGFFDYTDLNGTPENIRIFVSDIYEYDGVLNITSQTATSVSGNVNFQLVETEYETQEETLSLTGSFTANIEE